MKCCFYVIIFKFRKSNFFLELIFFNFKVLIDNLFNMLYYFVFFWKGGGGGFGYVLNFNIFIDFKIYGFVIGFFWFYVY